MSTLVHIPHEYMSTLVHILSYFILHLFCIRLNSSRLLTKLDWELCSAFFEQYNQLDNFSSNTSTD